MSQNFLEVIDLKTYFRTEENQIVKAVDGVSFSLSKGKTLAIVGESGSGKSVTNLSLMGLLPKPPAINAGGQALFHGKDLLQMSENELQQIRGNKISMVFQDPMTALNPFLKVSMQLMEPLLLHRGLSKKAAKDRALELLNMVGIQDVHHRLDQYPHQFSGGMRQRVMIAMALACEPEILIADEPTSALDVTIQAQILDLIQNLSQKFGAAIIMITHDLGVVAGMADEVVVMYAGRTVEQGTAEQIFYQAKHPYTQGLLRSVPRVDQVQNEKLYSIPGQPPNMMALHESCSFWPRCAHQKDCPRGKTEYPPNRDFGNHHHARCWMYGENDGK